MPVIFSLKDNLRVPHFEIPSAFPQTLLTVSGASKLNWIYWTLSVDFTEIEVAEAKGVAGGVVNKILSNEDRPQSQSASAPNPQNLKL
jgi:hypothetical protein